MLLNSNYDKLQFVIIYFLYYHISLLILSVSLAISNKKIINTKHKSIFLLSSLLLLSGLPPMPTFLIKCNLLFLISTVAGKYSTVLVLLFFFYYWILILNIVIRYFNNESSSYITTKNIKAFLILGFFILLFFTLGFFYFLDLIVLF